MPKGFFVSQIDQFHAQAAEYMGTSDFGPREDYWDNLEYMLSCADLVTDWRETGRATFAQTIVSILCSRLSAQQGFTQFPDYANQSIKRPILVVGYRSGTTALHKLLSSTSNSQTLEYWLTAFPRPRPPRETWKDNPFFNKAKSGLDQYYGAYPHIRASHYMGVDEADENHRADYSFCNPSLQGILCSDHFTQWTIQKKYQRDAYRELKKVLQLIGYGNDKKWVMKCPVMMMWMEDTLEQFPDATIVNTYRDPVEVIPSLCSTVYQHVNTYQKPDKKEFGRRILEYWAPLLDRYLESRTQMSPDRFLDVSYEDIVSDPLGTVKKIYMHCDGKFSSEDEAQVAAWHAGNKQGKHGKHEYSAEEYGLTADIIRTRTAHYRRFYGMDD